MGSRLTRVLAVFGAVTILVVGANAAAFAATGKSFILGKTNKAGKVTTIQRTTNGPALNIKTKKSTSAPFTTNSKGKVKNLNADKLDGFDSATLIGKATAAQAAGVAAGSDVKALQFRDSASSRSGDTVYSIGKVTAGTYAVTFNAVVTADTAGTTAAPQTMTCSLYTFSGFPLIFSNTYAANSSVTVTGAYSTPSFSTVLKLTGNENFSLGCSTTTDDGWSVSPFIGSSGEAPTLTFTKLDGITNKTMPLAP